MDDEKGYILKKVLNNNALIALDEGHKEVILIGKGIGFQRAKGDSIRHDAKIEKVFVLASEGQREQMQRLFTENDEDILRVITEYVKYVEGKLERAFTTQFFIALTDHLVFAIKRLQQGIKIHNPFLYDVRSLYPYEYSLAQEGTTLLENRLKITIPEDEIGFLALHIHSGRTNQDLSRMNRFSGLIVKLIKVIETELEIEIDKTGLDYSRLVTHLRYAIDRAKRNDFAEKENSLSQLLQKEYPVCYNIAWKIVKILQNQLKVDIPEAEVSYLTLHIQRILERTKN
ncbi:PtsGHI operon antiterminator [Sporomusa carbonis]|uniref:glucose PTS transporter transcription antiterminator GlcT n=1 Tax=Sporomusa carbonis TaxID=3076075 RepID=UPI003A663103